MAANLITFANGVVTPFLDGIMQELYTSGGGIITGGTITISGASTLHITQTHGALCGREFSIDDGDYTVQLSSSGTQLGRIYLHMDLSNTATPLEVLVETGASLTPVVQDANVNETNGVYEINLATFDVDESTISNLVNVAPTIKTLSERTLQTVADCTNSTDPQDIAGAAVISTLNSNLTQVDTSVTGIICTKTGTIASVLLNASGNNVTISADGKTLNQIIPTSFRPQRLMKLSGKVYNGSSYIDCGISIQDNGKIEITDDYGGAITGISLPFIRPTILVYQIT